MKTLSTTLLVLSLALSAAASPPGDQLAAADNATMPAPSSAEWRSSEIKSPHDFGPSEPIVTERDTTAFRKPGTLLSRTSCGIPAVDASMLAERKTAMYNGERFLRAPRRDGGDPPILLSDHEVSRRRGEEEPAFKFGWLGWTILCIVGVGALVAWRLGWFVPFSERRKARASQAASEELQNHGAKSRGPKIELVKRGA